MADVTTTLPDEAALPSDAPLLYRVDEAARLLSISRSTLRTLTARGIVPCRRIGRLVRYAPEDLTYFIHTRRDLPYV